MSSDEFFYPAETGEEPLVGEPVVDVRYEDHSFGEGTITIYDSKNPLAWVESDTFVQFGGDV